VIISSVRLSSLSHTHVKQGLMYGLVGRIHLRLIPNNCPKQYQKNVHTCVVERELKVIN